MGAERAGSPHGLRHLLDLSSEKSDLEKTMRMDPAYCLRLINDLV